MRATVLALGTAAGLLLSPPAPAAAQDRRPVVLVGATLIDGTGAAPRQDQVIVVTGDRLTAVGPAGRTRIPSGARIIDGRGKYVIPGLWDMHVHPDDPELYPLAPPDTEKDLYLPLFVANGVTGVRDMAGALPLIQRWRAEIAAGRLVGPRIVAGGPLVDGPEPMWPGSVAVTTPEQGRRAVDSLAALGVDFIKVYSLLPRNAWLAIVGAAKRAGLPVVGHLPRGVTAAEASDSGQRSIEHLEGILQACSDRDSVRRAAAAAGDDRQRRQAAAVHAVLATYDAGRCADLFARFARNGTWHTPTLVNTRNNAFFEELRGTHPERLDYLPHYLRAWWTPERNVHLEDRTSERIAELRAISAALQTIVGDLHHAGVRLLAGTDMGGNVLNYPGWSLHDELELFVAAGLSPMEALRTATSNPAEFLGLADSIGTVEPGKLADLVLLEADPTADIRNTRRIAAVMTRGRLLDRSALNALLADVKARAGRSRRELPAAPPG